METENGCWLWLGATVRGYGEVSLHGRMGYAHRVMYQLFQGAIPKDWQVHHKCGNPLCVNPDHLEAMPLPDHSRLVNGAKTHCKHGHPFDAKNTYVKPNGTRSCRECHNNQEKARAKLKRSQTLPSTS